MYESTFLHWDEFPSIKCHFGQLRVNKELTEGKSVFHNHVSKCPQKTEAFGLQSKAIYTTFKHFG